MESFFLPETSKYLYLLNSNAASLPDYYVFSTEGHLLPPFPHQPPDDSSLSRGSSSNPLHSSAPSPGSHHESSQACQAPSSDSQGSQARDSQLPSSDRKVQGSQNLEQRVQAVDKAMGRESMRSEQQRVLQAQQSHGFRAMPRNIWNLVAGAVTDRLGTGDPDGFPSNCQPMCEERKEKDLRKEQRALRRAFPLLDFSAAKSGYAQLLATTPCVQLGLQFVLQLCLPCFGPSPHSSSLPWGSHFRPDFMMQPAESIDESVLRSHAKLLLDQWGDA